MEIQELPGAQPDSLWALREEWDLLLDRCANATIYQTWEWNDAWWKAFGSGKRLRLVLILHDGRLVGIAPLYVSRHLKSPLRRMAWIGTGASDYLDLIAEDSVALEAADALMRYLDRQKDFDLADLQQLRPGSLFLEAACTARNDTHLRRIPSILAQEPCPYLPLPKSWETLGARFGKKMRSNLGYYDRLLFRTFPDAQIRMAGAEELDSAMDSLFDLHQSRWNARMLPGVMGSRRVRAFHRDLAGRFIERGWLRLHLIEIGGRIVSALYCFVHRNRTYYYLGGFDPELGKFSLGTVLTARAIQQALLEGCTEFDFLRGAEPYKYRWQPDERINHRALLADSGSLRSRAMVTLNRFERYIEHRAKTFAENRGRRKPK